MGAEKQGIEKKRIQVRIACMLVLFMIMAGVGLGQGAVQLRWADVLGSLSGQELTAAGRILCYVRIPRVAGAVIAGAGLAMSGAIIQIVLNNPLAGPNIIGVNAGSGFFVVLAGLFFPTSFVLLPFAAFFGAFITVLLVYSFGRRTGSSKITLVLAGVAINSLLNGASDVVYTVSEASLLASSAFRIGGLSGVSIPVLISAGSVVTAAFLLTMLLQNELEVFSLGEDKAKTLGLAVGRYRFLFLGLAAALAGAAVSFAGLLGFVGLIVPHVARRLVGGECCYFIPASAILGALLLVSCDYVARTWFAPYELPVGIILSFVGAPFFLWLLCHKKNR